MDLGRNEQPETFNMTETETNPQVEPLIPLPAVDEIAGDADISPPEVTTVTPDTTTTTPIPEIVTPPFASDAIPAPNATIGGSAGASAGQETVGGTYYANVLQAFKDAFFLDASKSMSFLAYLLPLILCVSVLFLAYTYVYFKTGKPNLLAPYGSIHKTGTTVFLATFNVLSIVCSSIVVLFALLKHFPFHFYWPFFLVGFIVSLIQIISCFMIFVRFRKAKSTKGTRNGIADTFFVLSLGEILVALVIFVLVFIFKPTGKFNNVFFTCFIMEVVIRGCLTFTIHQFSRIMVTTIEKISGKTSRGQSAASTQDQPNATDYIENLHLDEMMSHDERP